MYNFIVDFLFGWVPWWAWAGLALLALGGVYKWFGWQGVISLGFGVAAFFGYRQGWNDRKENKPPIVPVEDIVITPVKPPVVRRKRRTLMDFINGKTGS